MSADLYDSQFALLTLHGKEKIMEPLLYQHFNASLTLTTAFNTDRLGTFAGEVERELTPEECALKKASLACDLTNLALGLGSEGSFGPSPYGIGILNNEIIACINRDKNWVVIGRHYDFSNVRMVVIDNVQELDEFVKDTDPNQGLVMKSSANIEKALYGADAIEKILTKWFGSFRKNSGILPESVTLSYDLRAHHCPSRRINIAKACENLIERLKMLCPECKTPGFWSDQRVPGLPCVSCGTPTVCAKASIAICASCHYTQTTPVENSSAKQDFCPYCNP